MSIPVYVKPSGTHSIQASTSKKRMQKILPWQLVCINLQFTIVYLIFFVYRQKRPRQKRPSQKSLRQKRPSQKRPSQKRPSQKRPSQMRPRQKRPDTKRFANF